MIQITRIYTDKMLYIYFCINPRYLYHPRSNDF